MQCESCFGVQCGHPQVLGRLNTTTNRRSGSVESEDATDPGLPEGGNAIARMVRWIDRWQQGSGPAGFVFGVIKKFGDDRGGQLAALIAFSAFLAFFPLMLVVVTATAFLAQRYPGMADRIRTSAVAQFPVVGAELTSNERALPGSGLGLGIGLIGLLWGGFGVTQALQYAFHEVWHVPHKQRPSFVARMLRGLGVFGLIAAGVLATTTLGLVGSLVRNSVVAGTLGVIGATALSAGLFMVVFWLLSPKTLRLRELLPGAIVSAVGWQVLQLVGLRLVSHQLRRSSQLYGAIGAALGLVWFLVLGTQILLYSLEVTVVRSQRLWPRSMVQPPLTASDVKLMKAMAKQEERRPEEHIHVTFDDSAEDRESRA